MLGAVLIIGTGSATNAPATVGGTFLYAPVREISQSPIPLVPSSLRSLLHDTRSNFELSAAELASVLGVSRPTLYDWSAERAKPRIDRQRRLYELHALSVQWRTFVGPNIETVNRKFLDGPELAAILSNAALSFSAKSQELERLAQRRGSVAGAPSISDRLKALGFNRDAGVQQRVLDAQGW